MKTIFFGFLVSVMCLAVYGRSLMNIHQDVVTHLDTLKKEIDVSGMPVDEKVVREQLVAELREQSKAEGTFKTDGELDEDIQKMLNEVKEGYKTADNPLLEKLLEIEKSSKLLDPTPVIDFKMFARNQIKKLKDQADYIERVYFFSAIIILGLMILTARSFLSGLSLFLSSLSFDLSRLIIFLASVMGVLVWLGVKYNIFLNMGIIFLWGPLILLVCSGIALKIYDFNNPIWNRMFLSLVWPTLSGVIISFVPKG